MLGGRGEHHPISACGTECTPSASFLQKVFCGHEHTLANLEFAQKVEPCNDHVRTKLSWAKVQPFFSQWRGWEGGWDPGWTLQGKGESTTTGLCDQTWLNLGGCCPALP